jgi:hypothetical protein
MIVKSDTFLECWNSEVIKIKFLGVGALFSMNYFRIADLREFFTLTLLERALSELYVRVV